MSGAPFTPEQEARLREIVRSEVSRRQFQHLSPARARILDELAHDFDASVRAMVERVSRPMGESLRRGLRTSVGLGQPAASETAPPEQDPDDAAR